VENRAVEANGIPQATRDRASGRRPNGTALTAPHRRADDGFASMRGSSLVAFIPRVASAAFVLALPVLLVTTNVRIAATEVRVYEAALRRYGAAEATGIPLTELDRASREIIAYFENDAPTLRVLVAVNGEETALFSPRETQHMVDVKRLMRAVFRAQEVALVFVLSYVALRYLWAREAPLRRLAWDVLASGAVAAALVGGVGVVALLGFDTAWSAFHELVFPNDLWRLDPSRDRLIQMFPEPFWRDATLAIGLATAAELALLGAVAAAVLLLDRRSASTARPGARAVPLPVTTEGR
jgi:integral membrane protein (TIGR01906 family)